MYFKSKQKKVSAFFDPNEGGKWRVKLNVKLKKTKYLESYKNSTAEEKYLEILTVNPKIVMLEYSQMDYFVLLSRIPRNKVKLIGGMKYSPEKEFFDNTSTLNVSEEY